MSSDVRESFGQRLRELREDRGWTQTKLARVVGLKRTYLSEIESGKRNPSLLNLKAIADGFHFPLSNLFTGL